MKTDAHSVWLWRLSNTCNLILHARIEIERVLKEYCLQIDLSSKMSKAVEHMSESIEQIENGS